MRTCGTCSHYRQISQVGEYCLNKLLADTPSGVKGTDAACNEHSDAIEYPWRVMDKISGEGEVA